MENSCVADEHSTLYELDFCAWTAQQAKLLQEEKWSYLDIPNLVEEIESLGRQERRELKNRLGVLLGHLLKWQFQPENRSKSWFLTIKEQRNQVLDLIDESPSLKPYLPEALVKGYRDGLILAIRETALNDNDFPSDCPYSSKQVLDTKFLPGESQD